MLEPAARGQDCSTRTASVWRRLRVPSRCGSRNAISHARHHPRDERERLSHRRDFRDRRHQKPVVVAGTRRRDRLPHRFAPPKRSLPHQSEAVLLGSAILAATAAGLHPDIYAAMKAMSRSGKTIEPRRETKAYHAAKFAVFQHLYRGQCERRETMKAFS